MVLWVSLQRVTLEGSVKGKEASYVKVRCLTYENARLSAEKIALTEAIEMFVSAPTP